MEACQDRIEAAAEARPEREGMGTTLTIAYLLWRRLFVVHAGDSRCYLLRGGRLHRITKDQTVAQQLVDKGMLSREEADASQWSHRLWNVVGGGSRALKSDVYRATLQIGDILLLCTDGLTKVVSDAEISDVLRQAGSAERACQQLIALANAAGGPDNVTAVVARFLGATQATDATVVVAARSLSAEGEPERQAVPA